MSSKKKSKKVFQVTVSEIPEWNKQLAFDGLLVVEIWSPIYGPCDSIKPFVGPLMQKLEYDTSVQWPVVSIHKLEAEAIAEKKKGTKVHVISKYFGWHYPKPLWVFIRDKVILGEIYDANPPLLQRIIERYYKPAPEGGYLPAVDLPPFKPEFFGVDAKQPEPEAEAEAEAEPEPEPSAAAADGDDQKQDDSAAAAAAPDGEAPAAAAESGSAEPVAAEAAPAAVEASTSVASTSVAAQ